MDRYQIFRQLMDLLTDECEIVDADMHNWEDAVEINAVCGDTEIIISAKLREIREVQNG